ncbi:MAG: GTP cyclohydrolase I FolE [Bacteroides sp.]|nr:GTP cyclohydrolase I FolE [Bacillota bacterium]MCM1394087.1 GTP cyclohydrolase I FolE [[Eubacterium] siraeum]MCM1455163.1 GTP cyclohydrolase I FolE [Bacteroides sp.]
MVDNKRIENAVREILLAIGENPDREGLVDTPARVARMYEEITAGYGQTPSEPLSRVFDEEGGALVVERDIAFSSTCEHHLMPFFGKVHIAYIASGKVVGLSKLARVVDVFAKRLQLQERLGAQIADSVYHELDAKGVMVIIEAEHTCMTARGVKKVGTRTLTTAVRGDMPADIQAQVIAMCGING